MINLKKYKIIFSVFVFNLISCKEDDKCGVIIDKVIVENRYYFIFDSDNFNQFGGTDVNQTIYYVPDNRSSGEVSQYIYNKFSIGEEYCQS
tara:strand:- start:102 stop:374 length:273 start_codon:yes stop_codon:yes gene_type:complete